MGLAPSAQAPLASAQAYLAQAYLAQEYPAPVPAPGCPGLAMALACQGLVPGCLVLAQACLASAPGPELAPAPAPELAGMAQGLARRWRRNRIRRRHKRPAA